VTAESGSASTSFGFAPCCHPQSKLTTQPKKARADL
jgi:hypothetical protein